MRRGRLLGLFVVSLDGLLQKLERILRRRPRLWHATLDPFGHLLEHLGRAIVVRLLGKAYRFWQFETRHLEAIFQRGDPQYEKRAQLWLPAPDVIPHREILLPRGTEFEKNAIGKTSYLVELVVDRFAKGIGLFRRCLDVR